MTTNRRKLTTRFPTSETQKLLQSMQNVHKETQNDYKVIHNFKETEISTKHAI